MRINEASRRYARALYEITKVAKSQEKTLSELRVVAEALTSDADVATYLQSPVVPVEQKEAVLKKALDGKISIDLMNLVRLLAEKRRLELVGEISAAYEMISDEEHSVTRGTVRAPTALSQEDRKKIEDIVMKVTGKKVILAFTEDPKVLGGMVAQVGGWTFDDTLSSHLTRMNEELNRSFN